MPAMSGFFSPKEFDVRQILKLAPDALVRINNTETAAIIVQKNNSSSVDFTSGISSLTVQNNIDPPGSSTASIVLTAPIYKGLHENYWTDFFQNSVKTPIFQSMMEVKIYMKGRFLVDGQPKYYPVFWGFVNTVEENFSGGTYTFVLNCFDMLKWWQFQVVALKTSVWQAASFPIVNIQRLHTVFNQQNIYQIMWSLVNDIGITSFFVPELVGKSVNPGIASGISTSNFKSMYTGALEYWQNRFKIQSINFRMYGMAGTPLKVGDKQQKGKADVSQLKDQERMQWDQGKPGAYIPKNVEMASSSDEMFSKFMPFFDMANNIDYGSSETRTKLEIATDLKNYIYYEFFQDVNGDFIFKPPFYNLDVSKTFPYVINPSDIISLSGMLDPEQLISMLVVRTGIDQGMKAIDFTKTGFHVDFDLVKRFGVRYRDIAMHGFTGLDLAQRLAILHMSINNAKAYSGSITIAGRPEMKLGFPVYLPHKDAFYYVRSISHSMEIAGQFTTTIGLEAERTKSFVFKDGVSPSSFEIMKNYVYKVKNDPAGFKKFKQDMKDTPLSTKEAGWDASENRKRGMKEGLYDLVPYSGTDAEAEKTFAQGPNLGLRDTIPFTDKNGYKLIGGFPFGRFVHVSDYWPITTITPDRDVQTDAILGAQPTSVEDQRMNIIHGALNRDIASYGKVEGMVSSYYGEFEVPPSKEDALRGINMINASPNDKGTK